MLLNLPLQLKSVFHGLIEGRLRFFKCVNDILCSFKLFLGRSVTTAGALTGRGCLTRSAVGLGQDSRRFISVDVMRVRSALRHICFLSRYLSSFFRKAKLLIIIKS